VSKNVGIIVQTLKNGPPCFHATAGFVRRLGSRFRAAPQSAAYF
jgi:hypothetical protein